MDERWVHSFIRVERATVGILCLHCQEFYGPVSYLDTWIRRRRMTVSSTQEEGQTSDHSTKLEVKMGIEGLISLKGLCAYAPLGTSKFSMRGSERVETVTVR